MINALGIDVEEWYHICGLNLPAGLSDQYESRVVQNTEKVLRILDTMQTKATFFVLGVIAERFPDLVRKIGECGHEVASHGYRHMEVYKQTQSGYRDDLKKSINILQSIIGKPIRGYRAPSFSIVRSSLWALDILVEAGIQYDCSIFPVWNPRYGIPSAPRVHYRVRQDLVEFPPSTVRFLGDNYPIASGAYFRILPYKFTKKAIDYLNSQNIAVNAYIHTWEIDSEQPKLKIPFYRSFTHYFQIKKTQEKFTSMLGEYQFVPVGKVIQDGRF